MGRFTSGTAYMIRPVGSAAAGAVSNTAEGASAAPARAPVRLDADRLMQMHNAPLPLPADAPGHNDFHFVIQQDGSVTAIRRVVAAPAHPVRLDHAVPSATDGSPEAQRILAERGQRLAQAWAGAVNEWVHQGATALRDDAQRAAGADDAVLPSWSNYVLIAKACLDGDLSDLTQSELLSREFGLDRPLPPELLATLKRSLSAQIAALGPTDAQRTVEVNRARDLILLKLAGTAREVLRDPLVGRLFDALHAGARHGQSAPDSTKEPGGPPGRR